jgi:hypothetical protein
MRCRSHVGSYRMPTIPWVSRNCGMSTTTSVSLILMKQTRLMFTLSLRLTENASNLPFPPNPHIACPKLSCSACREYFLADRPSIHVTGGARNTYYPGRFFPHSSQPRVYDESIESFKRDLQTGFNTFIRNRNRSKRLSDSSTGSGGLRDMEAFVEFVKSQV